MGIDESSSTTTRLLTLLNVSATKTGKRKRTFYEENKPAEKLNKKRAVQFVQQEETGISLSEDEGANEADNKQNDTEGAEADIAEDDDPGECRSLQT